jgi:hypothetical protein
MDSHRSGPSGSSKDRPASANFMHSTIQVMGRRAARNALSDPFHKRRNISTECSFLGRSSESSKILLSLINCVDQLARPSMYGLNLPDTTVDH